MADPLPGKMHLNRPTLPRALPPLTRPTSLAFESDGRIGIETNGGHLNDYRDGVKDVARAATFFGIF